MDYTKTLALDVYNDRGKRVTVFAKQGDTARVLKITLTASGVKITPESGAVAAFRVKKPDGHSVDYPVTIEKDGTITVPMSAQAVACPGRCFADVYLSKSGAVLSNAVFDLLVEAAPIGDGLPSSDEYGVMLEATQKALEAADTANTAAGKADKATTDATAATKAANDAASKANTAAGAANTAAGAANTAAAAANTAAGKADASSKAADAAEATRAAAETAREAAETKRAQDTAQAIKDAQAATGAANTAAGAANTAAGAANTAAGAANTAAGEANKAATAATDATTAAVGATVEALEAARLAREAAESVIGEMDGVIIKSLDTQGRYIARFRIINGHPALVTTIAN